MEIQSRPSSLLTRLVPHGTAPQPLKDKSVAVALYNSEPDLDFLCGEVRVCPGDRDGPPSNCCMEKVAGARPHRITVNWEDVGLGKTATPPTVYDMWESKGVQQDVPGSFTVEVPPSGVVLLRVRCTFGGAGSAESTGGAVCAGSDGRTGVPFDWDFAELVMICGNARKLS